VTPGPEPGSEVRLLVQGRLGDPHHLLGAHAENGTTTIRAFQPEADEITVAYPGGTAPMRQADPAGLFEAVVAVPDLAGYRLRIRSREHEWEAEDPYRFSPTLGQLDLHLIGEGTHLRLWHRLGARLMEHEGVTGTAFAVWAPSAAGVHLVADANQWDARTWAGPASGSCSCPGWAPAAATSTG